jgi:hypothetical protein
LAASRSGIPLGDLDNGSVEANPAKLRYTTTSLCLFQRIETLPAARLALVFGYLNEFSSFTSLETAPD